MHAHVCPWWLAYTFDNPARKLFHNPRKIFSAYVREGMTAADIGCGMGYFSLGLARLVEPRGKVVSVDIQPQMLDKVRQRAQKARLSAIIHPHLSGPGSLDLPEPVDFALAFWMVHETPDARAFFSQIKSNLKSGAKMLFVEPKLHIGRAQFDNELSAAFDAGFKLSDTPTITFSHAALLSQ